MVKLREALKEQYHAGLKMLTQCVERCPEALWTEGKHPRQFWRIAYHTAFYAHLYMGQSETAFQPWPGRKEGIDQGLWETPAAKPLRAARDVDKYDQSEILAYIQFVDSLVGPTVDNLDLETDATGFPWYEDISKLSHELMNLRHIQGHVGQLSELLMASGIDTSWIAKA